jgi:hypothetical protein
VPGSAAFIMDITGVRLRSALPKPARCSSLRSGAEVLLSKTEIRWHSGRGKPILPTARSRSTAVGSAGKLHAPHKVCRNCAVLSFRRGQMGCGYTQRPSLRDDRNERPDCGLRSLAKADRLDIGGSAASAPPENGRRKARVEFSVHAR